MDNTNKVAVVRSDRRRGAVAEAFALIADDVRRHVEADSSPVIIPNFDYPARPWTCTHRDTLSAATDAILGAGASSITIAGGTGRRGRPARDAFDRLGYRAELWNRPATFLDLDSDAEHGDRAVDHLPMDRSPRRAGLAAQSARAWPRPAAASRSESPGLMASTGWVWVSRIYRVFPIPTMDMDTCRGKNTVTGGSLLRAALHGPHRVVETWRGWLVRAWLGLRIDFGRNAAYRLPSVADWNGSGKPPSRLVASAALMKPRVSLIDGFDGHGRRRAQIWPPPALGTVIAGTDPVAVDAVAASIMGFEPREIAYLRQAEINGLGTADLAAITILGDPISASRRRFLRHSLDPLLRLVSSSAAKGNGAPRPHFGSVPAPQALWLGWVDRSDATQETAVEGTATRGATMRIGFDGSCLSNRRGFGRFSRLLLESLARRQGRHQIVVVIDRPSEPAVKIPEGCDRVVVDVGEAPSAAASAQGRRRIGDMLAMGRAVARAGLDLMYFPATYTFFPVWNVPRLVVTMHDTLALAHPDLVFPNSPGPPRLAAQGTRRSAHGRPHRDRLRDIRGAIFRPGFACPRTGSASSPRGPTRSSGRRLKSPRQRRSCDSSQFLQRARYLLYVGGLSPHKNLPRLIEAFGGSRPTNLLLVVVGDFKDVFHTHVAEIRVGHRLGGHWNERVLLTGFVPDADLVYLYSRAHAPGPAVAHGGLRPARRGGHGVRDAGDLQPGRLASRSRRRRRPLLRPDQRRLHGRHHQPGSRRSTGCETNSARRALERAGLFTWDRAAQSLLECFSELNITSASRLPTKRSHG